MNRRRSALVTAGIAVLATACGGSSSERGLEQLVEQQTGGSVDLDFGEDGFNIQTEDGGLSIDDEGNFIVVGEDGEVVTGNIDAEGDSINIESDEGDATIEIGEGGVEVSGDEGNASFQASDEIPEDWPADVPQPVGLNVESGATYNVDGMLTVTVAGAPTTNLAEFIAAYVAALEAAGFTRTSFFESGGGVSALFENGTWAVSFGGGESGGAVGVTVVVAPAG